MRKLPVFVFIILSAIFNLRAELIINEIMQSNINCLLDDTNDFPDSWVEIYNDSDFPTSLSGYSLSRTYVPAEASPLPDIEVPARGYIVVYCDKKEG